MAASPFATSTAQNGDLQIQAFNPDGTPDGRSVIWNDPDFQAWNNAQQTPATLSTAQQLILLAKSKTPAQLATWWQSTATPAQQAQIIARLILNALNNDVV